MNILDKMITTIRGSIHEIGEIIIDSQAVRILDQEIRDADEELRLSKQALADMLAKHQKTETKIEEIKKKITEYEEYAVKTLEAKNEALAMEIATQIAELDSMLQKLNTQVQGYTTHIDDLQHLVAESDTYIKSLKQQADTIKATENVQKAQMTVAQRYSSQEPKIRTALESLENIKEKQSKRANKIEALNELADIEQHTEQLKEKLRTAGILPQSQSAQDILTRLKDRVKS
ncbi:MAG: PspA/IM30 family protein [Saezia sp.]